MAGPCYLPEVKDFKFSDEERQDIWRFAKEHYIDEGKSFPDTITGVANDLGLRPDWVARAFQERGPVRRMTNEVYSKMAARREVQRAAKDFVRGIDTPGWKRIASAVYNAPFSVAVFGHGTVGMQTHAGANLFRPSQWGSYFKNFARQFSAMRPAVHEAMMQSLVRDEHYTDALRSKLAIDPERHYTDYEVYGKLFGNSAIKPIRAVLEMGQRGFDVLKVYRLEQWKAEMNKLPSSLTSDPVARAEVGKAIAEMVNHSTGVADIGHGKLTSIASKALFAAKLEASRWQRIVGDPIKTVSTFSDWKNASAGERAVATRRVRNAAEFAGFYFTTLLANNAILAASGSQNRVNMTDPTKSDFLRHKFGDHTLALEGNLLAPVRFLAKVVHDLWGAQNKMQKAEHESRFNMVTDDAGRYIRGKFGPSVAVATDVFTGSDPMQRPLPNSLDKPRKGEKPYTWGEYAFTKGPIPLVGAVREVYDSLKGQGMSAMQTTSLLRGLAVLGAESTGAKIGNPSESHAKPNTVKRNPSFDTTNAIRDTLLGLR